MQVKVIQYWLSSHPCSSWRLPLPFVKMKDNSGKLEPVLSNIFSLSMGSEVDMHRPSLRQTGWCNSFLEMSQALAHSLEGSIIWSHLQRWRMLDFTARNEESCNIRVFCKERRQFWNFKDYIIAPQSAWRVPVFHTYLFCNNYRPFFSRSTNINLSRYLLFQDIE